MRFEIWSASAGSRPAAPKCLYRLYGIPIVIVSLQDCLREGQNSSDIHFIEKPGGSSAHIRVVRLIGFPPKIQTDFRKEASAEVGCLLSSQYTFIVVLSCIACERSMVRNAYSSCYERAESCGERAIAGTCFLFDWISDSNPIQSAESRLADKCEKSLWLTDESAKICRKA